MEKVADKQAKDTKEKPKQVQKSPIRQQYELLQQTVGNQKVAQMMQAGIIPKTLPEATPQEMSNAKASRRSLEEKQINADREALLPKILKAVEAQKDKLEALKNGKPGTPIFANVTVNLKYASIPGENEPLEVYNTSELAKVDLSYQNINQKASATQETKGYSIAETFSFVVDANEKKAKEEKSEEKTQKEKGDKKGKKTKENSNMIVAEDAGAQGEGGKESGNSKAKA